MLAELRMKIEPDNPDFGYYQSSNMHGVLMEQLDSAYADQLHEQGLKPYSQYLAIGEQKEWIIKTFTKEAYQNIISPELKYEYIEGREKTNSYKNLFQRAANDTPPRTSG